MQVLVTDLEVPVLIRKGDHALGRWSIPHMGIFSLWFLCNLPVVT